MLFDQPISFSRFFESNQDLTLSPFLRPQSGRYLGNLELKIALLSLIGLLLAAALQFFHCKEPAQMLFIIIYFATGTPALIESVGNLIKGNLQIDILMTVAAFASAWTGHVLEGSLLLVLFALSKAIETAVTARARSSLSGLRQLAPKKALIKNDEGNFSARHIHDVSVGDIVLIRSGEIVPLDGLVITGCSHIATAHLTGESHPLAKGPGDEITSGSQNGEGALQLRVQRTSGDSTLFRLIELVTKAHESRPKLQHLFERFESFYAKLIFALAALLALVPPLAGMLSRADALYRATCFLIAASPCALILAIPIAYLSSLSACARRGVILKGGTILDALYRCRVLAFDKTGTLTADQMEVESFKAWSRSDHQLNALSDRQISPEIFLQIYSAEMGAQHPVAQALASWGQKRAKGKSPLALSDFRSVAGRGITARLENQGGELRIGQLPWSIEGLEPDHQKIILDEAQELSESLICAAVSEQLILLFSIAEKIRPGAVEMIAHLRSRGITVMMLTGDRKKNAEVIAKKVGIDQVRAELTPEQKLQLIEELDRSSSIAMIGDGINDAPALARASVGIAMGGAGSALAAQAADIVLISDRLELLPWLIDKAAKTRFIVFENLILAIGAIIIASISSSLGLIPLAVAVCAHEGGTVLVGLNGLRLLSDDRR